MIHLKLEETEQTVTGATAATRVTGAARAMSAEDLDPGPIGIGRDEKRPVPDLLGATAGGAPTLGRPTG